MTNLSSRQSPFEGIKFTDEQGAERWFARDLSALLGYDEWRNFENVLDKAAEACKNVNAEVKYHFVEINKMVPLGSGSFREISDFSLSLYNKDS
jgi:DNA-damage-inducible protein D